MMYLTSYVVILWALKVLFFAPNKRSYTKRVGEHKKGQTYNISFLSTLKRTRLYKISAKNMIIRLNSVRLANIIEYFISSTFLLPTKCCLQFLKYTFLKEQKKS